ncbi:MAG: urea transporter [Actinomycetes bacterium]|jgi:urea transporter|nr:urea transporter [Actinomycetes bacterium]
MGISINSKTPKWLNAYFNSFSQVFFVENILTGMLVVISFIIYSAETGNWNMTIIPIIGCAVGNITAKIIGNDGDAISSGLFGFNPVLVCCAAALFFTGVPAYIVGIAGSIIAIPATTIINKVCARFGVPGFTMPFIATAWLFILLSFQTGLVPAPGREGALVGQNILQNNTWAANWAAFEWPKALTWGIGEIFPGVDTIWGGLVILLGIAIDRWDWAIKTAAAVVISLGIGYLMKADMGTLNAGLYTYCAILTFLGIETFASSKKTTVRYWALVLFALVLTVLTNFALATVLAPVALPCLTFPFVITTWCTLWFEQHLSKKE